MAWVIGARFELLAKIGHGAFGEVYSGQHTTTHQEIAIKIEKPQPRSKLEKEYKILKALGGSPGIPNAYWSGTERQMNILVMDLLGESLENVRSRYSTLSLKSVLMIADQMLTLLQYVHERNLIHRDVKPENFLFGKGNILYLIDFGLAQKYRNGKTHEHIPYREGCPLVGTARYVSINAHLGIELSRRDDLESVGYVIVYLLKGSLPWQGLRADTEQKKLDAIADMKMRTSYAALCEGLPGEFQEYFTIVRNLGFAERPPYEKLRELFRRLFVSMKFVYDDKYEWEVMRKRKNVRPASMAVVCVTGADLPPLQLPAPSPLPQLAVTQDRLPRLIPRTPVDVGRPRIRRKEAQSRRQSMPFEIMGHGLEVGTRTNSSGKR